MIVFSEPTRRSRRRIAAPPPLTNPAATRPNKVTTLSRPTRRTRFVAHRDDLAHGNGEEKADEDDSVNKRRRLEAVSNLRNTAAPCTRSRKLSASQDERCKEDLTRFTPWPPAPNGRPSAGKSNRSDTRTTLRSQQLERPSPAIRDEGGPKDNERRKLRSQDGRCRLKSELAQFFSNFDEVMGDEPKSTGELPSDVLLNIGDPDPDPDELTIDTRILILDDEQPRGKRTRSPLPVAANSKKTSEGPANHRRNRSMETVGGTMGGELSPSLRSVGASAGRYHVQHLDFSSIERGSRRKQEDPLGDAVYFKAHRRAEWREKRLRNIERNKAQHEKDSLERMLGGLKGPDWLRVMGISGITDTQKKDYEPQRDYFIREVTALIEKFKAWKEEEKRRKLDGERKRRASASVDDDGRSARTGPTESAEPTTTDGHLSDGDPPDYSDVDASAARQLHQEAILATSGRPDERASGLRRASAKSQPADPEPEPFTSFYAKPYQRAAALGKHRRSARNLTAFGHLLPDMDEREFQLPSNILTAEATVMRERTRRRIRRGSGGA